VNVTKAIIFLAMTGLLTFYGAERYTVLTREEVAYVYHSETDNVYTVVFGTVPDRLFKKHLLLPFHTPSQEIKVVEEAGSMRAYLREKAAQDTLFTFSQSPVSEASGYTEWMRWAGAAVDSVRVFGYRWDFPDLAWVPRRDLESRDLLPLELTVLLPSDYATWFWNDVHAVDAVVLKEQHDTREQAAHVRANEIEMLEGAVMIRGQAARYLERLLLGATPPTG
jgi:hypothetical protein